MMVESLDAIVANGAVGGSGRPKNLAGETILQFDCLISNKDFSCSWRRAKRASICAIALNLNLSLGFPSFLSRRSRNDA